MLNSLRSALVAVALVAGMFVIVSPAQPASAVQAPGCTWIQWTSPASTQRYIFTNGNSNRSCYYAYTTTCRRPNGTRYNIHRATTVAPGGVRGDSVVCGPSGARVAARSVQSFYA